MHINISIPLKLTRTTIHLLITTISIFCVLFPWSIITYLNFYTNLIPKPIYKRQLELNYEFKDRGPYIIINSNELFRNLITDNNNKINDPSSLFFTDAITEYELSITFETQCISPSSPLSLMGFRFSILDDTVLNHELKPWELDIENVSLKSKYVNLWPITDDLSRSLTFNKHSNYIRDFEHAYQWPVERSIRTNKQTISGHNHQNNNSGKRFFHFWKFNNDQQSNDINPSGINGDYDTVDDQLCAGGDFIQGYEGVYFASTKYLHFNCPSSTHTALYTSQGNNDDNGIIPSLFKPLFPPILNKLLRVQTTQLSSGVTDRKLVKVMKLVGIPTSLNSKILENSQKMKIVIELNNFNNHNNGVGYDHGYALNDVFIDNIELNLNLHFKGLRSFLFNHPITSFVIGVLTSWFISSMTCLIVSISLFWWFTNPSTEETKEEEYDSDGGVGRFDRSTRMKEEHGVGVGVGGVSVKDEELDDLDYNLVKQEKNQDDDVALRNLTKLLQS